MRYGDLTFDDRFRYATDGQGSVTQFTTAESAALALLVGHAGSILPRQRLLDATQRGDADALERSVDLLVNRLRAKLGDSARAPRYIATSYGEGYSWIAAATPALPESVYVAIGPAVGPARLREASSVRAFLDALADAVRDRLPSERGVSLEPDAQARATAAFCVEIGLRQDDAGIHCAVALRETAGGRALRADRLVIGHGASTDLGRAAAACAASIKSEIWRSLTRAQDGHAGPTDEPFELRLHRATVLLARTPQGWLESVEELEKVRAEHPDDPQTALMWASHLYARLVLDLASKPAELEPQIEALVFQALPHIRDNPVLMLAAAKLLCFVGRDHLDLAEALADEAFAQGTAYASAFAVLGQLKLNRGRLAEAVEDFDQGIELAEPGSEFQVFLQVLKCTTLVAMGDRDASEAANRMLYEIKPLTRMQLGVFLTHPDDALPQDLRHVLESLDAALLQRMLAHYDYLFVRRVPDAAGRERMFRGIVTRMVAHRPGDVLPPEVFASAPGLADIARGQAGSQSAV
ncbi:helix-turn-helix domain-containing protein [Achromobacter sp.]|uniref:winged helix-turn-helix domain-containing protein n=1 Tax=Achromobacter sp. TaxID=134375 RepID=UPI0028AAB194|nr:winged helix-turn-helix domain-containing protein [Achromobacter sp.]